MDLNVLQLIDRVIGVEGGYSDHPADLGGPTMWGITEQVARTHGYSGDMRSLPRSLAVTIYRQRYWDDVGLDRVWKISAPLAAELFDIAVNMGTSWSGKFLQRSLNALNRGASDYPDIAVDGSIGALTVSALRGYLARRGTGGTTGTGGMAILLRAISCLRGARYIEIAEANPSQEAFLYGWLANRVGDFS